MSDIPISAISAYLLEAAILAPSSHNTQPWVFRLSPTAIDLFADRTRALPVNDPEDRELAISCGCALMNMRIAAAAHGLRLDTRLEPAPEEPDWLARVSIAAQAGDEPADAALAKYIEVRRTYRKRFAKREVDPAVLDELTGAAEREGARLRPLLTEGARHAAAALVAEGDAAQWANPSWRRELAAWMHPRRRGDGLSVPAPALPVAQLVVRTFDMGGGVGAKDRELAEHSPLLAVLCTEGDRQRDWLRAGQALQRVLLVACRHGMQASYLNQPVEVAALRPKLQTLAGGGTPQLLLRIGYPVEDVPASPRRPLADVIETDPAHAAGTSRSA